MRLKIVLLASFALESPLSGQRFKIDPIEIPRYLIPQQDTDHVQAGSKYLIDKLSIKMYTEWQSLDLLFLTGDLRLRCQRQKGQEDSTTVRFIIPTDSTVALRDSLGKIYSVEGLQDNGYFFASPDHAAQYFTSDGNIGALGEVAGLLSQTARSICSAKPSNTTYRAFALWLSRDGITKHILYAPLDSARFTKLVLESSR